MAKSPTPYRALTPERRLSLVTSALAKHKGARTLYSQRLAAKGGGFRAATLMSWPVDKLAREFVRLNAQTPQDELELLQLLYEASGAGLVEPGELLVSRERDREALIAASIALSDAAGHVEAPEIAAEDLRSASAALGNVPRSSVTPAMLLSGPVDLRRTVIPPFHTLKLCWSVRPPISKSSEK